MTPAKYYLDDEREAPEGWVPVRDPRSMHVIFLLSEPGDIEAISFDHDLGSFHNGEELTGYWLLCQIEDHVAQSEWFARVCPDDLRVHSANAGARAKMELAVESIKRLKELKRGLEDREA